MAILPHYFSTIGPGAALAVVRDTETPRIECRGLADIRQGREITPKTAFDLASASKMFTAVAIMLLVERGNLQLMDAVGDLLPFVEMPRAGRPITVRDLLWHTSGLPDYLESGRYTDAEHASPQYLLEQLPTWSREAQPGMEHSYCNTGYFVLGQIIATVSGLGYGEFIHEHLVTPFDLRTTFAHGGPGGGVITRGYHNDGYGLPAISAVMSFELETLGDGGIFSCLDDLIRWQSRLWNGEIVSETSLRLMRTPGRLDSGESFEYGFGLQVETRPGGHIWCGHGGSWTGTTTLIGRYLPERTSVIVLSNEVMAPVERISQRALAISQGALA